MRLVNIAPPPPVSFILVFLWSSEALFFPWHDGVSGFHKKMMFPFYADISGCNGNSSACVLLHTYLRECIFGCVPVWVCMCWVGACVNMCVLQSTWTVFEFLFLFLHYHGYWSGGAGKRTVCNNPPPVCMIWSDPSAWVMGRRGRGGTMGQLAWGRLVEWSNSALQ